MLSVWFYQIRNLDYFQPWLYPEAACLSLKNIGWQRVVGAIFFLMGTWACLSRAQERKAPTARDVERTSEIFQANARGVSLVLMFAMLFGLSAIHAINEGYSAASRHQYAPLAMLALLVAVAGASRPSIERLLAWRSSFPLVLLVFLGQ